MIKDKTVITIAHRLRTVADADKIVVLDKGIIVEEGNFETLMNNKGLFYRLWNKQNENKEKNKMKNLDDFIYQKEKVNGVEVFSILGIPYAKAERFKMPQMIQKYDYKPINKGIGIRFPQNDVPPFINLFMKIQ